MKAANEKIAIKKGSCGINSLTEAAMAPMSEPMFIVFATMISYEC
jgi:hypothetical protein